MKPNDLKDTTIQSVINSLESKVDVSQLADATSYSKAQYYRNVKKTSQDPPMAIRRRLLIERAAFELTRTQKSISEIGMDAGFDSLEGFSRGFKKTFGVAPLYFRRLAPTDYRIDASERIHYAPASSPIGPRRQGELHIKLFERLIEHHRGSVHQMIDRCSALDPDVLDRELQMSSPFPWDNCRETVRRLLRSNVGFARPWMDSINGESLTYDDSSFDGLHLGLDLNCNAISELAKSIEAEGRWDLTFVDSLCTPPEVFTYIGVFGHIVTYNAHRWVTLINELKNLGITDLGFGDPIEFDQHRRLTS